MIHQKHPEILPESFKFEFVFNNELKKEIENLDTKKWDTKFFSSDVRKMEKVLDKGEYVSALFMDLSKAFDTINHDLLIAKPKVYGFSKEALKLMKSYLKNRKQKVQINNKFSSERDVIAGVPQGSKDGPLLFNLFINDLVFFIEQCTLSNYADDNNLSI